MIKVDTDKKLKALLMQMYQDAKKEPENIAYVQGLKDALKVVTLHCEQCADKTDNIPGKAVQDLQEENLPVKLHKMSPEEIIKLNLDETSLSILEIYTIDEMIEAAFRFENELMAFLGDPNCIEWETYAQLAPKALIRIINNAASDICRYNKG